MKKIAYQGVKGAFSYLTAVKEFGENHTFIGLSTFKQVFALVTRNEADYAVLPIENSLIGSIHENYDLLYSNDVQIIGEKYTKIEHSLLGLEMPFLQKEERLKRITKVLSHPKALAQCSSFFQSHPWMEAVVHIDTAAAAAEVASKQDVKFAAIASIQAGELYQLKSLATAIEDDPQNYTRFIIVAQKQNNEYANKCSLLIKLAHLPGSLSHLLSQFAKAKMNLTKIESRPLIGSPFEYTFYIDLEFVGSQKNVVVLLEKLKTEKIKVLGFYKRGDL